MSATPSNSGARSLALLAVAFILTTATAQGQDQQSQAEPARLQGVVVLESTFEPIPDAVVTLIGTDLETHTGPLGQFAIADAPPGQAWVRVTAPGLPSVRERVDISEEGVVFLQFRMPEDVFALLDEVSVNVFANQITSIQAESALELVAAKVPSIAMTSPAELGNNDAQVLLRGYSSFQGNQEPIIVIDNVVSSQTGATLEVLSRIPASDVESIEVLRGPEAAFRYPYATNGVISITTKK